MVLGVSGAVMLDKNRQKQPSVITRTFRVGRHTATVTVPRPRPGAVLHASCEWSPRIPDGLTDDEQRQYEQGMAAVLAELSQR